MLKKANLFGIIVGWLNDAGWQGARRHFASHGSTNGQPGLSASETTGSKKLPVAMAGLPDWKGRIGIDANNPIEVPLFKPADLGGRASSAVCSSRARSPRGESH
jgi:hypothetical protein